MILIYDYEKTKLHNTYIENNNGHFYTYIEILSTFINIYLEYTYVEILFQIRKEEKNLKRGKYIYIYIKKSSFKKYTPFFLGD